MHKIVPSASKGYLALLMILLFIVPLTGRAQRSGSVSQSENGSMSLGISTASTGPGINLAYKFNKFLTLRTGYDGLNAEVALDSDIDGAQYDLDIGLKLSSLFAIVDLYYLGPLFISGGAGYNMIQLNADATHSAGANTGALSLLVRAPQKITPYVGFGLGRKVAKNRRIAFSADIGLFYLGQMQYTLNSSGLLAGEYLPDLGEYLDHPNIDEIKSTLDMFTIYPVLKFGVSYKFLR